MPDARINKGDWTGEMAYIRYNTLSGLLHLLDVNLKFQVNKFKHAGSGDTTVRVTDSEGSVVMKGYQDDTTKEWVVCAQGIERSHSNVFVAAAQIAYNIY